MKSTMTFLGIISTTLALAAAPVPKQALPPITEAMWKASADNLRAIGQALHNYHDVRGEFPGNVTDEKGTPVLSWRVRLLPFLDGDDAFAKFKMNEPWDSESNKALLETMPRAFAPVRLRGEPGHTYYLGFDGPDTLFERGKATSVRSVVDGCRNTVMLVEAEKAVPWTKPEDVPFDAAKDPPKLGAFFDGAFNVLTADGAVSRAKKDVSPAALKAAIRKSDGQVVDVSSFAK
jgi:hypothetical protein